MTTTPSCAAGAAIDGRVLRPSAAARWSKCPGSSSLEALFPEDEESPAAREGTAAHWYATEALQNRYPGVGDLAPNGVPLDAEMIEGGDLLVAEVLSVRVGAAPTSALHIEQKFTMHKLVHPMVEGTPDVVLVDGVNHRIWIWDYKYGHRYVDQFSNPQLIAYTAGVIEAYELDFDDVKGWEIHHTIVQPRNYTRGPVRTATTMGWLVWKAIAALAERAAVAAVPYAPTQTGEHCRDCDGRHACEALQRVGSYALDVAGLSHPQNLTPVAMGLELKLIDQAAKRLEARRTALSEIVLGRLARGEVVPGWVVEHGQAREKWTQPVADVVALGQAFGKDLRKPQEAITPTQARKLLGVDGAVIDAYAERPRGAAKLVLDDGSRAREAFGNGSA